MKWTPNRVLLGVICALVILLLSAGPAAAYAKSATIYHGRDKAYARNYYSSIDRSYVAYISVCDNEWDGNTVYAKVRLYGSDYAYRVVDRDGWGGACATRSFISAQIRDFKLCEEDNGCTSWAILSPAWY